MTARAGVVAAVVVVVAGLLQVTVVAFLPAPLNAADLVAVSVLAVAHARGPGAGALLGIGAGAWLDVLPPAAGPLGGWVLVLGLAGLVTGRVAATSRPGPFAAMLLVALSAAAVVLARSAVLWFAGSPPGVSALAAALAAAGAALVLAPLALLLASGGRQVGTSPRAPEVVAP